jgi:hypothetical protein
MGLTFKEKHPTVTVLHNSHETGAAERRRVDSLNEGLQPSSAERFAHLMKALEAEVKRICSSPDIVAL